MTLWDVCKLIPYLIWSEKSRWLINFKYREYIKYKNYLKNGIIYNNVDAGLIVSRKKINGENRYAVFKHPLFENYGFKLVD